MQLLHTHKTLFGNRKASLPHPSPAFLICLPDNKMEISVDHLHLPGWQSSSVSGGFDYLRYPEALAGEFTSLPPVRHQRRREETVERRKKKKKKKFCDIQMLSVSCDENLHLNDWRWFPTRRKRGQKKSERRYKARLDPAKENSFLKKIALPQIGISFIHYSTHTSRTVLSFFFSFHLVFAIQNPAVQRRHTTASFPRV